ncbi:MAG: peptide-methionine (R)-S-oxide reductase MsrB [Hyphomicrobium sp.]|uniref:peptide-methionine (R)-S-oxide reductase MsrB n=1 Tax=Hyphomicrobium sp. TaxID=82 RepID=UPI0039E26E1C
MYSRRDFSRFGLALAGGIAALKSASGLAADASNKTFEVTKTDEEWRKELTPEQYQVLRKQGTERAGTSPLDANDAPGTYLCAGCQLALFSSETKYHSGTGWPSFWKPLDGAVDTETDNSYFMTRTEVHCHRCGGHLGHVFEDGPKPTGLRYCMNGVALKFVPKVA